MKTYQNIQIPYPENISAEEKRLFEPYVRAKVRIPRIKNLKNVFVTHQGLVLKNGLLVGGCAFNLRGNLDNTFYFQFWKDTLEKYLVCRWGKSLPSVHLKGPQQYLLIHSKWFNYAFWINAFLPRLLMAEQSGYLKNTKLIVPENWKNIPYVWDSLKAFDVDFEVIPSDHHIFVDRLIMPETRQWTASFYPPLIKDISARLIQEAQTRIRNKTFPKKIYLTRAKRKIRTIENEEELICGLGKYGFEPVIFEDLSIWEQIAMMNNADFFISIHGAGFSNIMFMKNNASVIELINKKYASLEYTFPFWKLSDAVMLKYYPFFCEPVLNESQLLSIGSSTKQNNDEKKFLVNSNVKVDIEKILTLLKNLL